MLRVSRRAAVPNEVFESANATLTSLQYQTPGAVLLVPHVPTSSNVASVVEPETEMVVPAVSSMAFAHMSFDGAT